MLPAGTACIFVRYRQNICLHRKPCARAVYACIIHYDNRVGLPRLSPNGIDCPLQHIEPIVRYDNGGNRILLCFYLQGIVLGRVRNRQ